MPGSLTIGIVLAELVLAQPQPSDRVTSGVWLAGDQTPQLNSNDRSVQQLARAESTEAIVRHMRGAPGTLYAYAAPELDRRLHQMASANGR